MMAQFYGYMSLVDELDKKLLVVLRDGKTLIGFLRSIDQFGNFILHRTIERIHVGDKYGDIPRGIFIVRGDYVMMCGEISEEKEQETTNLLKEVSVEEIIEAQQKEFEKREEKRKLKQMAFQKYGFFTETPDDL